MYNNGSSVDTLDLGSGTVTVSGNWTNNGSAVVPGSSTVTFDAVSGAQ
jgi:hypothetical protein